MLFNVINHLEVEIETPKKPYETGEVSLNPIIGISIVVLAGVTVIIITRKRKSIH